MYVRASTLCPFTPHMVIKWHTLCVGVEMKCVLFFIHNNSVLNVTNIIIEERLVQL